MAAPGDLLAAASPPEATASRIIDLAFGVDERFIPHLTVALTSVALHAGNRASCRCWVSCDAASWLDAPRSAIERQGLSLDIRHLPLDRSVLAAAPVSRHISAASYDRLLIPPSLPRDVSRVLYLDADVVVESELVDLFDQPLFGRTVGAVFDASVPHEAPAIPQPYFNAGVMLVDLQAWMAADVTGRALRHLARHRERLAFHDQDILNVVLEGDWLPLDPRWNVQTAFWEGGPSRYLTAEAIVRARRNPGIVHYSGYSKPWQFGDDHPWRDRYHAYRRIASVPREDGSPSSVTELVRRMAKCVVPRRCRPRLRHVLRVLRGDAHHLER